LQADRTIRSFAINTGGSGADQSGPLQAHHAALKNNREVYHFSISLGQITLCFMPFSRLLHPICNGFSPGGISYLSEWICALHPRCTLTEITPGYECLILLIETVDFLLEVIEDNISLNLQCRRHLTGSFGHFPRENLVFLYAFILLKPIPVDHQNLPIDNLL
jgi:hypothetical protein